MKQQAKTSMPFENKSVVFVNSLLKLDILKLMQKRRKDLHMSLI